MDVTKRRFKLIVAVYLILRRGDEVLLVRRINTGYQDGRYSFVAGHIEGDELATDGMAREAREEAGITIDPGNLKLVHTAHRLNRDEVGQERIDLFFETSKWSGKVTNAEPDKCNDLSWFSIEDLPDTMTSLAGLVLDDIVRGVAYSEYTEGPV